MGVLTCEKSKYKRCIIGLVEESCSGGRKNTRFATGYTPVESELVEVLEGGGSLLVR